MVCIKCKKEIPVGSIYCNFCGKKQIKTSQNSKRKKRPNGTGTVYKLSGKRKRPWIAIATKYVCGIRETYIIGYFSTETEGFKALSEVESSTLTTDFNSTLKDIYKAWSSVHFKDISKCSIEGYESAWKHLEYCHNKKMRDIKTDDFQQAIQRLVNAGKSRSSCEKIRILANKLSEFALERDIVSKNYAQFLKMPKGKKVEKEIFTKKERELLFKHQENITAQIILTMIYTGTRINELFSIETENVFIEKRYMIGGSKTDAGIDRIIPLNNKILPFITEWYNTNNKYLLSNTKGGKKNARNFREREFYPFLESIGILSKTDESHRLTPHNTRHTFSSLMVKANAKPELLQKIIGHENYETTIDVYTHFTEEDVTELVEQIDLI